MSSLEKVLVIPFAQALIKLFELNDSLQSLAGCGGEGVCERRGRARTEAEGAEAPRSNGWDGQGEETGKEGTASCSLQEGGGDGFVCLMVL
jgi:hypothetical protein